MNGQVCTTCLPIFSRNEVDRMKVFRNIFFLSVLFISLTVFTGCKNSTTQKVEQLPRYEDLVDNADTVEVMQLVDRFFGFAMEGNASEAAGMLFMPGEDVYDEPLPMDNDNMAEVRQLLESITIKSYHIDYIKFNEAHDNEVKVTAVLEEAHDDMPAITTVFYFKPQDYLSNWVLCMADSRIGQNTIIESEEQDSLSKRFSDDIEKRNQNNVN